MASTEVNVGRVQGAGFFYSTYADDDIATTIDKGTVLSELTIFEKDMIVDAKGRLYEVISIIDDVINVEYKSTMQGEKGDTGDKGDKGDAGDTVTIKLNNKSTSDASFYAPTDGGTSGQFLVSNGTSTNGPQWNATPYGFAFAQETKEYDVDIGFSFESTLNPSLYDSNKGPITSIEPLLNVGLSLCATVSVKITATIASALSHDLVISFVFDEDTTQFVTSATQYTATPNSTDEDACENGTTWTITKGTATTTISFKQEIVGLSKASITIKAGSTSGSTTVTSTVSKSTWDTAFVSQYTSYTYDGEYNGRDIITAVKTYLPDGLDVDTVKYSNSQTLTNGYSTIVADNLHIDSYGKIECKELWVNGKQIT